MRLVRCDNPEDWMPFKIDEDLLWIGEIGDMPGHAVVVTSEGNVIWGWHSERFLPYLNEEPNMQIKQVKLKTDPYPVHPSKVFLWLGIIDNSDFCVVVNRKGKVIWNMLANSFEIFNDDLNYL